MSEKLGDTLNTPHDASGLEYFPNKSGDIVIDLETPEFTCVCPKTGQPDFATMRIRYVPGQRCVESKSLKLYIWSFRDVGAFHEHVTRLILDDLVALLEPPWIQVIGDFGVRGGIKERVLASHRNAALSSPTTEFLFKSYRFSLKG